jgi:hypothetical protein
VRRMKLTCCPMNFASRSNSSSCSIGSSSILVLYHIRLTF